MIPSTAVSKIARNRSSLSRKAACACRRSWVLSACCTLLTAVAWSNSLISSINSMRVNRA